MASSPWATVALLTTAYALSFVDRQILTLLVQPVRSALGIDDVQFSLLHGFAFAITYAVGGIPLGALADRYNRKWIIASGILIWSIATAACGLAENFGQLFSARVFVGLGEAALVPATYSILADLFGKEERARPMAVFMSGSTAGAGLALWLGGLALVGASQSRAWSVPGIESADAWRVVFLIVGSPGIVLFAALALLVREPARRQPARVMQIQAKFATTLSFLWVRRRMFVPMYVGFACFSFSVYALSTWIAELFRRSHGWAPENFAMIAGPIQIGASVGGALGAGWVIDIWTRRGRSDAALRLSIIAIALLAPLIVFAVLAPTAASGIAAFAVAWIFMGALLPAPGVALQLTVPPQRLALASAFFMLTANLIGMGCGPTAVALMTRHVFASDAALGRSVALVGTAGLLASVALLQVARRRLMPVDADLAFPG